ncbi:MAG: NAD(P)-binding domain-containing protein, partial [Desulfobacterales bacterium]|nr:NAD(P)-binding domain-containing protein [Desulfobacterales bacterium]
MSFLGAGNMGEALVSGLIISGSARPENILCADIRGERLEEMRTRYGVGITSRNTDAVAWADVIIYAVKPQLMAEVLQETADQLDLSKVIISIAAG